MCFLYCGCPYSATCATVLSVLHVLRLCVCFTLVVRVRQKREEYEIQNKEVQKKNISNALVYFSIETKFNIQNKREKIASTKDKTF